MSFIKQHHNIDIYKTSTYPWPIKSYTMLTFKIHKQNVLTDGRGTGLKVGTCPTSTPSCKSVSTDPNQMQSVRGRHNYVAFAAQHLNHHKTNN